VVESTTARRWPAVRSAFADTGARFADVIDGAAPHVLVTKHWTLADCAAHVAALTSLDVALVAAAGEAAFPFPQAQREWEMATIDTVHSLNTAVLKVFPERDPGILAGRIRADVDRVLADSDGLEPATAIPWLGGSKVPLIGLLAHMVNEFQIHGRDIARAVRRPWSVSREEAGFFFDDFMRGVVDYGYGHLMDTAAPFPRRRIAVAFRSRYTRPLTLMIDKEVVSVADGVTPDVRVTFDPVVFNLMLFGRISVLRATLSGGVRVGGPRPWLLPAFMRKFHMPN